MKSGLLYLRPTKIAYVRVNGHYQSSIPAAWEKIFAWLEKIGCSSSMGRGYGLTRDNPATVKPENCRYDACIEMEPYFEERAIRELGAQMLPGGSYVRNRRIGSYEGIIGEMPTLHQAFMPGLGLMVDERRPIVTVYLDDPMRLAVDNLRADICMPVKTKAARNAQEAA